MRILDKHGIKKWRMKRKLILTPEAVAKCLEWALEYVDWILEQWMKLIFSNKCSIEQGARGQQKWCFRTLV